MAQNDFNYREIITKAVCGRGRKFSEATHHIKPTNRPTSILGCWVINHKYDAAQKGENVEVTGSYDINVWFSYANNTKTEVVSQTVTFTDIIELTERDQNVLSTNMEVLAEAIQQPNTLEATIAEDGNRVAVQVEREFLVECIGETKISVACNPDGVIRTFASDDEEDEVSDEEFERLDPNFLHQEMEKN
ncbi:outer spore coat protein CotE [Alkalihalobacillus pseudalcaliphilus]|uniref:outer spore coat protein CotE n=1 Tax=Alkalihalobacillus pseudalcaliphilus TaxID=79884 RepID=UPI00064D74AC|nr:outer spore coat protein CotE [Alkalihalobacillus pseudalcaliphilus]KMK77295.1 spore coat protein [Alkalihalobacillus pseudalcaliphilus]